MSPSTRVNPEVNLMIRDVAKVRKGVRPVSSTATCRSAMTITARGRRRTWVGRAAGRGGHRGGGEPPRGVWIEKLGQFPPMMEMFKSLGIGWRLRFS